MPELCNEAMLLLAPNLQWQTREKSLILLVWKPWNILLRRNNLSFKAVGSAKFKVASSQQYLDQSTYSSWSHFSSTAIQSVMADILALFLLFGIPHLSLEMSLDSHCKLLWETSSSTSKVKSKSLYVKSKERDWELYTEPEVVASQLAPVWTEKRVL